MARKLNKVEEQNFIESLQNRDAVQAGATDELWWQKLVQKRDKPLNLNTASKEDLMSLPGMTSEWAEAIVVARPYDTPRDVVKRRIVPQSEYDKIADRVTTSGGKPSPGI